MTSLLLLPLHVLSLFTGAKNFRTNPVIGSRLLNRVGLHGLRFLAAHLVMRLKWAVLWPLMPRPLRKRYHRDGFVVIEDFLDAKTVADLSAEAATLGSETRQLAQGDTFTQRILLAPATLTRTPTFQRVVQDKRLKNWIGYAGGCWRRPLLYLQRIRNGARAGSADPQKTMHSDTFHPTVKAWLFLEDVTLEKGPFTYVPGSHRLTKARLALEHRTSQNARDTIDGYTEKGSFRLTDEAQAALGLAPPKSVTAKAGTLVIANTHGFHGRGAATEGASRLELWAYSRHNPFLPWPGIGVDLSTRVEEWALPRLWRYRDRAAAKQDKRASWHLIDRSEMLD